MSNCNSPLLDRASPFRADSVDRGDAYQVRKKTFNHLIKFVNDPIFNQSGKDLVIGELTARMKRNRPKAGGFDKNKRSDGIQNGKTFERLRDSRTFDSAQNLFKI